MTVWVLTGVDGDGAVLGVYSSLEKAKHEARTGLHDQWDPNEHGGEDGYVWMRGRGNKQFKGYVLFIRPYPLDPT